MKIYRLLKKQQRAKLARCSWPLLDQPASMYYLNYDDYFHCRRKEKLLRELGTDLDGFYWSKFVPRSSTQEKAYISSNDAQEGGGGGEEEVENFEKNMTTKQHSVPASPELKDFHSPAPRPSSCSQDDKAPHPSSDSQDQILSQPQAVPIKQEETQFNYPMESSQTEDLPMKEELIGRYESDIEVTVHLYKISDFCSQQPFSVKSSSSSSSQTDSNEDVRDMETSDDYFSVTRPSSAPIETGKQSRISRFFTLNFSQLC